MEFSLLRYICTEFPIGVGPARPAILQTPNRNRDSEEKPDTRGQERDEQPADGQAQARRFRESFNLAQLSETLRSHTVRQQRKNIYKTPSQSIVTTSEGTF